MNVSNLKSISEPGNSVKPNEDELIITDNLYIVLDGATGIGRKNINDFDSDAHWFVKFIASYFDKNWRSRKNFITTLKLAVKEAQSFFNTRVRSSQNLKPYELPSAGVVAIHVFKKHIRAYRIGDCSLYVKSGNIITDVFGESSLHELDEKSISQMSEALKRGLTYAQARESIKDLLRNNRSKMNTVDGYAVLSINPDSVYGFETRKIDMVEGIEFLLTSDGFSAFNEKYNYTIEEVFNNVKKKSLRTMVKDLRVIEQNDSTLLKYPRLKPSDDASCIYLEF